MRVEMQRNEKEEEAEPASECDEEDCWSAPENEKMNVNARTNPHIKTNMEMKLNMKAYGSESPSISGTF
jgi:hypothetical protein